jgi:hypothetical protein
MHRWVRYEAPVMVCMATGDDGQRRAGVVIGEECSGNAERYRTGWF